MGLLATLRARSWVMLPRRFPRPAVARRWLQACPALAGANAEEGGASVRLSELTGPFACYHPHDILRAPGVMRAFNSQSVLDLVGAFLGCKPVLYSVNAWWSFPGEPRMVNVQFLHRDDDDSRPFVAMFTYLTDVAAQDGPHQIIEGSHDPSRFPADTFANTMGEGFSAEMERRYGPTSITGPAGAMFLSNTTAIHRGLAPSRSPRLMLWARYGHGPNSNSMDKYCPPIAASKVPEAIDTPALRAVNRLIVDYT